MNLVGQTALTHLGKADLALKVASGNTLVPAAMVVKQTGGLITHERGMQEYPESLHSRAAPWKS